MSGNPSFVFSASTLTAAATAEEHTAVPAAAAAKIPAAAAAKTHLLETERVVFLQLEDNRKDAAIRQNEIYCACYSRWRARDLDAHVNCFVSEVAEEIARICAHHAGVMNNKAFIELKQKYQRKLKNWAIKQDLLEKPKRKRQAEEADEEKDADTNEDNDAAESESSDEEPVSKNFELDPVIATKLFKGTHRVIFTRKDDLVSFLSGLDTISKTVNRGDKSICVDMHKLVAFATDVLMPEQFLHVDDAHCVPQAQHRHQVTPLKTKRKDQNQRSSKRARIREDHTVEAC